MLPSVDPSTGDVWTKLEALEEMAPAGAVTGEFMFEIIYLGTHTGWTCFDNASVKEVYQPHHAPVADAGSSRYTATNSVWLDGGGSYDPDNSGTLIYQWQQISGPAVVITDSDTATPTISGFTQTASIQSCEFELIVNDGDLLISISSIMR